MSISLDERIIWRVSMSSLWNLIDSKEFSDEGKIRAFFFLNCLVYCIFGFLVWLVISRVEPNMNTWDWALCLAIYPGFFIGYIGGFIYLCRRN